MGKIRATVTAVEPDAQVEGSGFGGQGGVHTEIRMGLGVFEDQDVGTAQTVSRRWRVRACRRRKAADQAGRVGRLGEAVRMGSGVADQCSAQRWVLKPPSAIPQRLARQFHQMEVDQMVNQSASVSDR